MNQGGDYKLYFAQFREQSIKDIDNVRAWLSLSYQLVIANDFISRLDNLGRKRDPLFFRRLGIYNKA